MSEYSCSVRDCQRIFHDEEYTLIANANKCILHCEKNETHNNWENIEFQNLFDKVFKEYVVNQIKNDYETPETLIYEDLENKNLIFKKKYDNYSTDVSKIKLNIFFIHFPKFEDEDEYSKNYTGVFKIFKNFFFLQCHFHQSLQLNDNYHCFFQDCFFYHDFYIYDLKVSQNIYDVLFDNCEFKKDVIFNDKINDGDKYEITEPNIFKDCIVNDIIGNGAILKGKLFIESNKNKVNTVDLIHCIFHDDFIIDSISNIKDLNLENSTFEKKVKIQFCDIENDVNFYNTKFNDLADFYQTKFNKVNFERTDFNGITVFSETKFNQDINFKYTKFLNKSIFRDMIVKGKLDLRNTIFAEEANFLDITAIKRDKNEDKEFIGETTNIQVANRETARIIKHNFEKIGNNIDSNKYHALELDQKKKELEEKKPKSFKEYFEIERLKILPNYIVFKLHSLSSEHSTNWILALLWIIVVGFATNLLNNDKLWILNLAEALLISISFLFVIFISHKYLKSLVFIGVCFILLFFDNELFIQDIFKNISLINLTNSEVTFIGLEKDKLTPWQSIVIFLNKISLGYLYYQFVIAVRKDTRK